MIDPLSGIFAFIGLLVDDISKKHQASQEALQQPPKQNHPEPHRNPETGKIVIENCKLYYEDVDRYGAAQAQKWVREGRYNLSPEEYEKELKRINAHYDSLRHK